MTMATRALTTGLLTTALALLDSTAGAQAPAQRRPQQVPATGVDTLPTPAELAGIRTLDQFTNRSIDGLTFEHRGDGTIGLDLQGRFQNVMRAHTLPDGRIALSCAVEGHAHGAVALPQWTPDRAAPVQRLDVPSRLTAPIVVAPKAAAPKRAPAPEVK